MNDIDSDTFSENSNSPFEVIKQVDLEGNEFWSARDLMSVLEYGKWENLSKVIIKAILACQNSGQDSDNHFQRATKIIILGSAAKREAQDFHLSRYACYLIVQNGDPSKTAIALGQTYFAVQTHRQELADRGDLSAASEDKQRLTLRQRLTDKNRDLASSAKKSGVVTEQDFAIFQNHGYQGLYNGLSAQDIHKRKALKKSAKILDHMGSTELAANYFRATQANDILTRDGITEKLAANNMHYRAGKVVRAAIEELGGTMPENLPTPDSIKKIEREERKKLKLQKQNPDN